MINSTHSIERILMKNASSILKKYEFLLPLGLFLLFLVFTLPGISWGAPSAWHPDEIVVRSINALSSGYQFSEINFDYPDLPQYAMFFLGKVVFALGILGDGNPRRFARPFGPPGGSDSDPHLRHCPPHRREHRGRGLERTAPDLRQRDVAQRTLRPQRHLPRLFHYSFHLLFAELFRFSS